ncbi:hypothetical protein [Ottowia sp.]|uniref:hypothetical protein n=1 Tax=Ottowia sp. TaxID=1898956 RepID=UPI0025DACF53|nr:hypothetical protein [Ottowia sp.]MBK6616148.1 hypothetical protein [Ottowia sp.]
MTGEQLGQHFLLYMAQRKPPPFAEGEVFAYLYGDSDYVIDRENCVLHFPNLPEPIGYEKSDDGNDTPPQWLALIVQPNGESEIVAGECMPYSDEAKELLPHTADGVIRAMPYLVWKQMQDPVVRARLASKHGPGLVDVHRHFKARKK